VASASDIVIGQWLVLTQSKAPFVSLSKKLYPPYLVLVVSRNRFEHDFTIKLIEIMGLIED